MHLRLATYNVAWFARLFAPDGTLLEDGGWSSLYNVTRARQLISIAEVIARVDPDILSVIEAPNQGRHASTVRALEAFAARFGLRQRKAILGFASETEQEIALLFDPDRIRAVHRPMGGGDLAPRFDGEFPLDLDGDGEVDLHIFSKPPLEALIEDLATGRSFRVIAVHAKSKAAHGAKGAEEIAIKSLLNRRKQLAQCAWIRARVDEHLAAGDAIVAMGDFNDGPGLDKYERVFGRSGVEVVMGDPGVPERLLRNPYTRQPGFGGRPATARFYQPATKGFLNALIDFVMLSPDLSLDQAPSWRIWHPFDDAECFNDGHMRQALLDASDHFPVSVDLMA
ncbi:MAG: endonuclease/exonuclease/phosphatase family protein [Pseudomonadota bacterium]